MLSTPNRTTYPNHSENRAQDIEHEDDVQSVKSVISLYQANKIDKSNAWNCELIDKLETLVRNHNAFVRNFRNIGMSLDATMRVYEIRVDSVCNDVRRLGYGTTSDLRKSRKVQNRDECESENEMGCVQQGRQRKRRKFHQVHQNIKQMNSPLKKISTPDELLFKLNSISEDFESAKRLFLTILPSKKSLLQVISRGKFIDNNISEPIEFQDSYDDQDDFFIVPVKFPENLPIRPISCGLSGYEIRNSPIGDDHSIDMPKEVNEPDVLSEYAFDPNIEYSMMAPSQMVSYSNNVKFSVETSDGQDFNNNIDFNDDADNRSAIDTAVENISKGEYSYNAFLHGGPNAWAGPTYWKVKHNRNGARDMRKTNSSAQTESRQQRGKKNIELPKFAGSDSDSSDNELFIKLTTRKVKSIRKCQYRRWLPDKLKLPPQINIPKDLFHTHTFAPSNNIFGLSHKAGNEEKNYEDNDYNVSPSQIHFDNYDDDAVDPVSSQVDEINNYDEGGTANISENYENPPQMIEKIQIAFEKRAKVINVNLLNKITLWSIDRQLKHTANIGSICSIDTGEDFEPGKAVFSSVHSDLQKNQRKFMPESEITPSLALFSILIAVNRERLRINRTPDKQNDFEIVQLKKKP